MSLFYIFIFFYILSIKIKNKDIDWKKYDETSQDLFNKDLLFKGLKAIKTLNKIMFNDKTY